MKTSCFILASMLFLSFSGLAQDPNIINHLKSDGTFVVKAVFIDGEGMKWFGTNRGLLRYNGETWTYYTDADHLISNAVNTLAFELSTYGPELWVGTDKGVSVVAYDVEGITGSTSYTAANGVMGENISAVAVDSRHNKFFGSEAGITYFHSGTMDSIIYKDYQQSLVNAPVNAFKLHNDSLYIAFDGGIGRLISGVDAVSGASRWTSEYGMTPLSGNIKCAEVDSWGHQWFGTDQGAERHVGLEAKINWFFYTTEEGLIHNHVLSITEDEMGGMWFGTYGGVSYLHGDQWTSYTAADGLASDTVYDIAVDKDGSVWFATQRGISQLYESAFIYEYTSVIDRPASRLDLKSYYNSWENAIHLSYRLQYPENISVSLYSIDGVLYRRWANLPSNEGHNQVKLPFETSPGSYLKSGIYILRVSHNGLHESNKIVIIR